MIPTLSRGALLDQRASLPSQGSAASLSTLERLPCTCGRSSARGKSGPVGRPGPVDRSVSRDPSYSRRPRPGGGGCPCAPAVDREGGGPARAAAARAEVGSHEGVVGGGAVGVGRGAKSPPPGVSHAAQARRGASCGAARQRIRSASRLPAALLTALCRCSCRSVAVTAWQCLPSPACLRKVGPVGRERAIERHKRLETNRHQRETWNHQW
jgi:hypothetical protein